MRGILRLGCAACMTALATPTAALLARCLWPLGGRPGDGTRAPDTALGILDARYARGEIEREEYLRRKQDLLDRH